MSSAHLHAEWLSLVEVAGPFLTLPVLQRALPHGLDPTDQALVEDLRQALQEFEADPTLAPLWTRWVIGALLGFPDEVLREGAALVPSLTHRVAEHGETLRPDVAVVDTTDNAERARLFMVVWPIGTKLWERPEEARWAATPVDRMAELCRATGTRLGLVTNGDTWVLVDAPMGAGTATATWDAALWLEERSTLDAFTTLLGVRRFFSVAASDTLEALLAESATAEAEVTDQLGRQVRAAVELLVDAMSRANRERQGAVFADLTAEEIYESAVTVMMRLVFLLSAEERGLFLLGDETYDTTYAVSTLLGQLDEEATRYGEDVLERRTDAWHRLLATFRLIHGGAVHENLRVQAYGGSLFDPDRFPFLEGRSHTELNSGPAPLPIDNRTIKHILDALQVLRFSGRGGVNEARRLSFRSLDVEQIGHVYEGLLDHSAVLVTYPALGLDGKKEAELALEELEAQAAKGRPALVAWLVEHTGLTARQTERALDAEPDPEDLDRLISACENDRELADRVTPFLRLLRQDLRGLPLVYLPDSYYVTESLDRRSSGAYYTPRALAEEMVTHTLEPLVYDPGPAQGADRETWVLKGSVELLDVRVCDMAMGSGAFLVAACRYLSGRLLEAWDAEGIAAGQPVPLSGGGSTPMPDDETDREVLARRLVADRCLYGVDRNPMAVEMAKLSMWLITLAKDRPFTFVDHALRCGDSLLGITNLRQLDCFHLDPAAGRALHGGTLFDPGTVIEPLVKAAMEKRRELESFPVVDVRDAEHKRRLLNESSELLAQLKVIADLVVGAALATSTQPPEAHENRLLSVADDVLVARASDRKADEQEQRLFDLSLKAMYWLDEGRPLMMPARTCLHWPLEFPEVFLNRPKAGFDAVIGNPPFLGGKRVTGAIGTEFREYMVRWIGSDVRGSADLVAYFFLRAAQVANRIGLLATNTVAQGDTREVALDQLLADDWRITRAMKSSPWPGQASLEVARVWLQRSPWKGMVCLEGVEVSMITSMLDAGSRVSGPAYTLAASRGRSHIGSFVNGIGFVLSTEEAEGLLSKDSRNSDVIFPYLGGEDLNSHPEQRAKRWIINFFDWPLERAELYPDCLAIVRGRVKPERDKVKRAAYRERWWRFAERQAALYEAVTDFRRVLAIAATSKTVAPAFASTGQVFSHALAVFAYDDNAHFGLLSSAFHWWWAVTRASTMRTDIRYTPTDCFETFPQPILTADVDSLARQLNEHRAELMVERREGLTKTYNRFHAANEYAEDIGELRRLHAELDHTVAEAYGWDDLDLDHGTHETPQGIRYTIGPAARTEVLDRLLELNHEQYAEEVRHGLHAGGKGRSGKGRPPKTISDQQTLDTDA